MANWPGEGNFSRYGGGTVGFFGIGGLDSLDKLIDRFSRIEDGSEERLRDTLFQLEDDLRVAMDRFIGPHPTLQNAQETIVKIRPDRSGYVAIKPRTGGYRILKGGKSYRAKVGKGGRGKRSTAPGIKAWDLTRFTNDGHAIRRPKYRSKSYRPRIHVPYVSGKLYYDKTRRWAQMMAEPRIRKLADELAGELR